MQPAICGKLYNNPSARKHCGCVTSFTTTPVIVRECGGLGGRDTWWAEEGIEGEKWDGDLSVEWEGLRPGRWWYLEAPSMP